MVNKLFKFFIPHSYTIDEEKHRKAKITIGAYLIIIVYYFVFSLISKYIEFYPSFYSHILLTGATLLCLFLYKSKIHPTYINIFFFILNVIDISTLIYFTNGYESFILPWITIVPAFSLLLTKKQYGIHALITSTIIVLAFFFLHLIGYKIPVSYNTKYTGFFSLIVNIGLIYILYFIAIVFENTKNVALRNIDIKNYKLDVQKKALEEKQKEILDSISYAKKIQQSILPSDKQVKQLLPDSFILYKPKDIVSGDFYWVSQWGNKILFAAVDCTGHGVPGAFMSIMSQNLLNQAINEYGLIKPNLVLNSLNKGIAKTLNQNTEAGEIKDGMDIALCCLDTREMTLEFAGAYNPLWILRKNEIIEIPGDKFPVGYFIDNKIQYFQNNEIKLEKGDTIYIFTDGYADQFGGEKGKKFKKKEIKKLLIEIKDEPLQFQKYILDSTFENWKGTREEQLDDILFIGVRV